VMRSSRWNGGRAERPLSAARAAAPLPSKQTQAARERLTFSGGARTVPGRGLVEAALLRDAKPTFATAAYAEPRDWGYGGLLAFTAVLLLRPQDTLPILNPLHLAELCAIIGIAPMIMHRFAQRLPVFRVTPETIGLMTLGAVMLATVPFSIWPSSALDVALNAYFKIVLVFVLMMNTLTTPKRVDRLVWLILLCFGYVAGRAVLDYARGMNLVENDRLAGPVGGIFGNPNDLALNMVTFLPAAALIAMTRGNGRGRRVLAAAIAVLMLAVIVFTKSRGGLLGLLAMIAAFVVLARKVRRGVGTMAVVSLLIAAPLMPQSFWTRMTSIVDEQQDREQYSGSREARRNLMQEGLTTFAERPLTGVGAGQFKNYNPPWRKERWREVHNVLIQVAADTGLFGLLAFCFLLVRGAIVAARARRLLARPRGARDPDLLDTVMSATDRRTLYLQTTAMTVGLIGWFVCALFAPVAYSWTFYYPLAILVAAYELTRDRLAAATLLGHEVGRGRSTRVTAGLARGAA